jgi:hypothetical protein
MVANVGGNGSNIWLASHSLGSAIALHVGKTMAKSGIFIESFLFNPPFPSVPLDQVSNCKPIKQMFRFGGSVIKASLGAMNSDKKRSSNDSFSALSAWIPNLFVNRSDYICSKYVEYFEHRIKMEEIGFGGVGNLATQNSLSSQIMSAFGKESEPLHLIPSALLIVNLTPPPHNITEAHWIHRCLEAHWIYQCLEAHGLNQWWKPDLQLESNKYKY